MISVQDLCIQIGGFSLRNISFEVPQGEFAVLMGKTGSGKTTILESVCGLKTVQSGRIVLHEEDVTQLKPSRRGVGYVPQDGALFSTMTVWDQLAFSLIIRKWARAAIAQRVEELAEMLGIEHLLHRLPNGLSGGEAQRVALGRALAYGPSVLCLDEPLSALDEETRAAMYELLKKVQHLTHVTALHVTHSRGEARALADRLFVMENGSVRQTSLDDPPGDENLPGESLPLPGSQPSQQKVP